MAKVFSAVGKRTPVTARLSTIAGNLGNPDTVRDLRGLAFKYMTKPPLVHVFTVFNCRLRTEDGILDWVSVRHALDDSRVNICHEALLEPPSFLASRSSEVSSSV